MSQRASLTSHWASALEVATMSHCNDDDSEEPITMRHVSDSLHGYPPAGLYAAQAECRCRALPCAQSAAFTGTRSRSALPTQTASSERMGCPLQQGPAPHVSGARYTPIDLAVPCAKPTSSTPDGTGSTCGGPARYGWMASCIRARNAGSMRGNHPDRIRSMPAITDLRLNHRTSS